MFTVYIYSCLLYSLLDTELYMSFPSSDVDVTGVSVPDKVDMSAILAGSSSFVCRTFNEHFATLAGDPFKSSTPVEASDTDDSDTADSDGELFSR